MLIIYVLCFVAVTIVQGSQLEGNSNSLAHFKSELVRRGVAFESVKISSNGVDEIIWLSFAGMSNPALSELIGLDIRAIDLSSAKNCDWNSLSNMPLQWLDVSGTRIEDLSPVGNLPLEVLLASYTKVKDLKPLSNMRLKVLHVEGTPIKTLEPIRNMALEILNISQTKVSDLRPIENMPITTLVIDGTEVRDVSPLRNSRLEYLIWSPELITNGISLIRNMSTLKGINRMAPDEFWNVMKEASERCEKLKVK